MNQRDTARAHKNKGFTLLEMLVATGVFVVIITISIGTILVGVDAVRKVRLLRNAMDNMNIAVEGMSKRIRTGVGFHCGYTNGNIVPQDCSAEGGGSGRIAFSRSDGQETYAYRLMNNAIEFARVSGPGVAIPESAYRRITPEEVRIENLKFYVVGALPAPTYPATCALPPPGTDCLQPYITITISGFADLPGQANLDTDFFLQTSIAQGVLDL